MGLNQSFHASYRKAGYYFFGFVKTERLDGAFPLMAVNLP